MLTTESTPCVDIKSCEEITQSNTHICMYPLCKKYVLPSTLHYPVTFKVFFLKSS
jgi:hypothetical protein